MTSATSFSSDHRCPGRDVAQRAGTGGGAEEAGYDPPATVQVSPLRAAGRRAELSPPKAGPQARTAFLIAGPRGPCCQAHCFCASPKAPSCHTLDCLPGLPVPGAFPVPWLPAQPDCFKGRGAPLGLCNLRGPRALPTPPSLCLCAFCLKGGCWPMAEGLALPFDSQVPARPHSPSSSPGSPHILSLLPLAGALLLHKLPSVVCLTASGDHSQADASHLCTFDTSIRQETQGWGVGGRGVYFQAPRAVWKGLVCNKLVSLLF